MITVPFFEWYLLKIIVTFTFIIEIIWNICSIYSCPLDDKRKTLQIVHRVDVSNDFEKESKYYYSLKGTVIIKVHLDMKDTGMPHNYQNMSGSYKSKKKNP